MFMGFILATLAIFAGVKIATSLLVMAVPVVDALWVIGERIKSKKPVFGGDNRHLHYKLLELGWSQKKIMFFFCSITLCVAVVALNTRAMGKVITLLLVASIMIATLIFVNRKIKNNSLKVV